MDSLTFWWETFPELFERGVEQLRTRADANEGGSARQRLEDVVGARGAVYVEVEGEGSMWLGIEEGGVRPSDTPPAELPVRLALAIPAEAMRAAMAELEQQGALQRQETALSVARLASRRAQSVLEGHRLQFHVIVEGVPDLGQVRLRVGLGVAEPPQQPTFTAGVQFDDLERAREGELGPQQLLTGGRVRFTGDYAPALQLGMQLSSLYR